MKRTLSVIALLLAVIMIAMCCVACGDDDKKSENSNNGGNINITPATNDGGMSMGAFLNTDKGKQIADSAKQSLESSSQGLATGTCYAEGQCFVLDCKLTSSYDSATLDQMKPLLQQALEAQEMKDLFNNSVISAFEQEGIANASMKVIYRSYEGEILAQYTYG